MRHPCAIVSVGCLTFFVGANLGEGDLIVAASLFSEAMVTVILGSLLGLVAGLAGVLGIRSGLARAMGRSVGSVKALQRRGLRALRDHVEDSTSPDRGGADGAGVATAHPYAAVRR